MSRTIDSRVVEMKFDNKQFESGVKQSLGTLGLLKQALKFKSTNNTFSGISKSAKSFSVDISGIAKNVAALEKRFSFMGETIRKVTSSARDSLVNTLGKGINFVTDAIVSGGIRRATNIEGAHFQLQALLKDETKVQAVMDDAMDAVDGTAYGFDEAAKAASMFTASGITAGKQMQTALKGITGTAAMTNSEFNDIALIFTSVAGQGRVLGDQLLQLSARGLNAPATIAQFFNDVTGGTVKASDEVTAAVKKLSKGAKVTEGDIRDMVSDSQISFNIFAEAMGTAFGDSAKKANETFQGSLANMKAALARIGAEFVSPLIAQNSEVVLLFNTLKDAVNRVKKTIAFDKEIGNTNSLSLRFSNSVLAMAKAANDFVSGLDIESGMQVFFNVVDTGINIVKAFASVVSPLGKVVNKSLGNIKVTDVIKFTANLKDMTAKMSLTEKQSKGLEKGFQGVVSVGQLLGKILLTIIKALIPTSTSVGNAKDSFFDFIGVIGDGLTAFTKWVDGSKLVEKGAKGISEAISVAGNLIKGFINVVVGLGKTAKESASSLKGTFGSFSPSFNTGDFISKIDEFKSKFDFSDAAKGMNTFVTNLDKFKSNIDFTKVVDNLSAFRKLVSEYAAGFQDALGGMFSEASIGGAVAGAGGIGIITAIVKISKSFEKATGTLNKIPDILGSVSSALKAYQADLKADALKKTASAILILAGAIAVLSLTDTDKAMKASEALSLIAGVLLIGTSLLLKALGNAKPIDRAANAFSKGINNFAKALKWKAIGSAMKDMGATVLMIVGAVAAIGILYQANASAVEAGGKGVAIIAGVIVGMIAAMSLVGQKLETGMSAFLKSSVAIGVLSFSILNIIKAIKQIMKIDIPDDINAKMTIFRNAILAVGGLAVAAGLSAKIAGNGKTSTTTLVALCLVMLTLVSAVKKFYNIELPADHEKKNEILIGIFTGLSALILAIGAAAKLAGGAIKAAGTLLSLCAVIVTITASLMILSIIPSDGMLKGAVGLGAVLLAVAVALAGAGKIGGEDTYKSVLSMALMVGTIVAALGVLSMVDIERLKVSAGVLGATLLALAINFKVVAANSDTGTLQKIVGMIGMLITITASLVILAQNPWEQLLAAGASLSMVVVSLAATLGILSKSELNLSAVVGFVSASLALLPISGALLMFAGQSWSSITPGAVALNTTAIVLAATLALMSKASIGLGSVVGFVSASLALLPISAALKMLAGQSWSSITPGAVALNATAVILGAALVIISKLGISLGTVISFVAATVALIPIAAALKTLSGLSWEEVANGLIALAGGLTIIGVAGIAGTAIAPGLIVLSGALLVFAAAIAATGVGLLAFVASITTAISLVDQMLGALQNLPAFADMGRNMIQGFINGIVEGFGNVVETVKSVATGVVETVKGVLGIHSPSTVFESLGLFTDQGFAQGLTNGSGEIDASLSSVFGGLADKVDVSSMLGLGEEATNNFGSGLLSGEGNVDGIMSQIADATGIDVSSFSTKGGEASNSFGDGVMSGGLDIQNVMSQVMGSDSIDVSSFLNVGENASNNFGSGVQKGKSQVDTITKQVTDVSQVDLASYQTLGRKAAEKFIQSFQSGSKTKVPGAAKNIATTLSKAISNAVSASDYTSIGTKAISTLAQGFKQAEPNILSTAKQIATGVASSIKAESDAFKVQGNLNMVSYANGLKSGSTNVISTIKATAKTVTSSFKTNDTTFKKSGSDNMKAYNEGLKSKTKTCTTTVKQMTTTVIKSLDSKISEYKKSGTESGNAYISAMQKAVKSGASTLQSAASIIGKQFVQGVTRGITSNSSLATNAAKKLAQQIDQSVKKTLDIHSPSKKGQERGKQYDQGLEKGLLDNAEIVKKAAMYVGDGVDAALGEKISKTEDGIRRQFNSFFDRALNQQKNRTNSVIEEHKYWDQLLAIKKAGAEAEKYQDMSLIEFRKSILEQEKEIRQQYKEQVANEQASLSSQLDMWSEVNSSLKYTRQEQAKMEYEQEKAAEQAKKNSKKSKDASTVTLKETKSLTEQLQEQTKLYNSYVKEMKKVKKKLKDTNVLEEVMEFGVDQLPLLKEINQMTNKELSDFVEAYDKRTKAVEKGANVRLAQAAKDTQNQLNELYEIGTDGAAKYQALQASGIEKEQTYWEKLLAVKKMGSDAEKYQDMEIADFRKSILEETQKILDEYTSQFEQTRSNIMSQMDLFSEVEEKQAKTKEELVGILESQVQAYKDYAAVLESLSTRLQGTNLLDYLRDLGVGSLGELQSINSMTDEELSQYATLYDEKLAVAGEAANTKLKEIQTETEKSLQELFGTAAEVDLTEFEAKFDGTIESITAYLETLQEPIKEAPAQTQENASEIVRALADGLVDGVRRLGGDAMKASSSVVQSMTKALVNGQSETKKGGTELATSAVNGITETKTKFSTSGKQSATSYTTGIKNKYPESKTTGQTLATNAVNGVKEKDQQFQNAGQTQGTNYTNGLKASASTATSAGSELASNAADGLQSRNSDYYRYGQYAAEGFIDGMRSKTTAVKEAAKDLANAAADTTKSTLDEHSPSKVMKRIGIFAGAGFINGLFSMVTKAALAGKELADASTDSVESAYDSISSVLTDEMFSEPVIRPIVDLSNVQTAANNILSMFNRAVQNTSLGAIELDTSIRAQRSQNKQISADGDQANTDQGGGNQFNFVQNNYSPKPLSSIDIYRKTNNQFQLFERRVNNR